ncbi:manganese/iron transport system permease protein [Palleronia marisminoris]|uniref:Manganese transport system membrane protein MntB n=1 Tax=Palleronia marisminoris TaxID=315423 RepID=A0A1Y5RV62_9RHOB|nr:metal ABC transporter permease [Palleronia marisminoris]SFG48454.1 manganese/iron transport system permease protein [Palleronia marisminoris]SLN25250.1 Manganese transport system membrane protein MntB [Palleronia marisminoris]
MNAETLLLPFQFPFMRTAFLIGAVVSVPAALLSCFLVLKGWALMGDAISHAVLPGIVLAHILGLPLIVGAFAAGMACAVATGFLTGNSRVKPDTVLGVVYSGMFAAGIVLFVSVETGVHLDHILFGNMLGVSTSELWTAAAISAGVGGAILLKWRDWLLHAFDPAQARASGLAVGWLHYGMLAMLSLTIVATLSAAGLILAIGLLIAPGAIAFLTARTFRGMLIVAVLACMGSMLLGTYLSFFLDSAPAPTAILVLTALFVAAFLNRALRGAAAA